MEKTEEDVFMHARKIRYKLQLALLSCIMASWLSPSHAQQGEDLFDFAQALMRFEEKRLYDPSVEALRSYLAQYPESERAADVQFALGVVHEQNKNRDLAFIAYLKTVTLYPHCTHISDAKIRAGGVIASDSRLSPIKEKLHSMLDSPLSGADYADTFALFIQSIRDLVYPKLNDAVIPECRLFVDTFQGDSRAALMLETVGDMEEENGRSWEALAAYLRTLHFYGTGDHVLRTLVKVGDLFAGSLKQYDEAVATYERILASSSDTSVTGRVQWRLAHVLSDDLDNHSRAVQEYQALVDRFPSSEFAPDGLWSKAEIHAVHLNQFEAAVSAYRMLADHYPDDPKAPEALAKAGEVYEESMNDYANAITVYEELTEKYPKLDLAANKLYEAAELAEKRLEDIERAIQLYETIVDRFAGQRIADRAQRKIDSLKKQMVKE